MPSAVVALTGASGAQYAVRLVEALSEASWEVDLIVTNAGAINLHLECEMTPEDLSKIKGVTLQDNKNLAARPHQGLLNLMHISFVQQVERLLEKLLRGFQIISQLEALWLP